MALLGLQGRWNAASRRLEHSVDRVFARVARTSRRANYLRLLDQIHQHVLPRTYLEIGTARGHSLSLALPGTSCIGIDPKPEIQFAVPRHSKIYAMTSDDFFEKVDLQEALLHIPLDLAFIDGMHRFEVALRDFMNLESLATSDTTILVHDCLPPNEVAASRKWSLPLWTGDVWKTIAALREWRPDLSVAVADTPPSGLAIIRNLDPASTVLRDHYDELCERYVPLSYDYFEQSDKTELLGVIPGDFDHVRALLPRSPFRDGNLVTLKIHRLLRAAPLRASQLAGAKARALVHVARAGRQKPSNVA